MGGGQAGLSRLSPGFWREGSSPTFTLPVTPDPEQGRGPRQMGCASWGLVWEAEGTENPRGGPRPPAQMGTVPLEPTACAGVGVAVLSVTLELDTQLLESLRSQQR